MRIYQHYLRLSPIYPGISFPRIYIQDQGSCRQLDFRCSIYRSPAAYLGISPPSTISLRCQFGAICGLISARDEYLHLQGEAALLLKLLLADSTGTHNAKHVMTLMSVWDKFMTGFALLRRVAIIHAIVLQDNPLISEFTCQPRPGHDGQMYLGEPLCQ